MLAILHVLGMFVADLVKSRSRLEAENLFLRHQLNIALRPELAPRVSMSLRGGGVWTEIPCIFLVIREFQSVVRRSLTAQPPSRVFYFLSPDIPTMEIEYVRRKP
jgi:hypothetical protein